MATRVMYRKIYDDAQYVQPDEVNMAVDLTENSKEAVLNFFSGALKIFVLDKKAWVPLETSPVTDFKDAKFLVVKQPSTSGVVPLEPSPPPPPSPPPAPREVDLGDADWKYAARRVVQILTQAEGRPSTAVPLGTGSLIMKNVIVTARHTVVDRDGDYVEGYVDGQKVEFIIANPAADLALLRLAVPRNLKPLAVATFSTLTSMEPVATLGYPLEAEMSMHKKLVLQQGHIVGVDRTADRAFCTKFAGLSEASGAAVLYARDHLAGIHVGTMNHPNASDRPLQIPPLKLPELFETDKENLWAMSSKKFNQAEAKSVQESYKEKYPGEHAIITPAHHIIQLQEAAGLIPRDPLCRYPAHLAKG